MAQTNTNTDTAQKQEEKAVIYDGQIGHYFDVAVEDTINFQSQITDNYIENNTAIQDHIALSPITISMHGYIGEIVFQSPATFWNNITGWLGGQIAKSNIATTVTTKLTTLTALLPPVDNITQAAKDTVQYVEASYDRYKKIYDQLTNKNTNPRISRQEDAANRLKQLWQNRTLVEVITPYGYYENMAIQSITLTQGNTTTQSDLSVTLKQINKAETNTTKPDEKVMAKYNAYARAEEANLGKAQGVNADNETILKHWRNKYGGGEYGTGIKKT